MSDSSRLPWSGPRPLMLAPMQGLTNRALRQLFIQWVAPDVVFTEFLQVRPRAREGLSAVDCAEIQAQDSTPLVVQLIGRDSDALVAAAEAAQQAGARHLNINMGCPYGRMTQNAAGGALLKHPERVAQTLSRLRAAIDGSFSVKLRAGYDDPEQVFELLPLFETLGVDFLVLHPRTVAQKYSGLADHAITARVCAATSLPVIANGDIKVVADAETIEARARPAGLMLGRGAIADPWLFTRLRGEAPVKVDESTRRQALRTYLLALLERYRELFAGDAQALYKLKEVIYYIQDEWFERPRKKLRRATQLETFRALVEAL